MKKSLLLTGAWPHAPPTAPLSCLSLSALLSKTIFFIKHFIMHSKYHFWKISNSHLQKLLGLSVKRASERLREIRDAYGKTSADDVRFFELCEHQKLNPEEVPLILGWD